jgi:hypothetical protein
VARVSPLNWNIAIVQSDGRPTEEFQRAWQEQLQANGDVPAFDTAAEVSALLDKIGNTPGSLLQRGSTGWQLLTGANGDFIKKSAGIWQPQSTAASVQDLLNQLGSTRGSVLYRGSGGWSVLTPGTAGYVLSTNGAGADPAWIAAGGGGGGGGYSGVYWTPLSSTTMASSSEATKGVFVRMSSALTVKALWGLLDPTSTADRFSAAIFEMGGASNNVLGTQVAATTTPVGPPATGIQALRIPFTSTFTFVPSRLYCLFLTITSGTGATPCRLANTGPTSVTFPGLPCEYVGNISGFSISRICTLASNAPTTGATVSLNTTTYGMGLEI